MIKKFLPLILSLACAGFCLAQAPAITFDENLKIGELINQVSETADAIANGLSDSEKKDEAQKMATSNHKAAENAANQTITSPASFATELQGTLKDYLSLFEGFIQAVQPSEDGKKLSISFSPLLVKQSQVQIKAVAYEPEPFTPFLELVTETQREAMKTHLTESFDDNSDLGFEVSWNAEGKNYGRRFSEEQKAQISKMYLQIIQGQFANDENKYQDSLALEKIQAIGGTDALSKPLKSFNAAQQMVIKSMLTEWMQTILETHKTYATAEQKYKFDRVAQLVNNQNQFHVTASYRDRDPFVGPDQFSFNATYEFGRINWRTWSNFSENTEDGKLLERWQEFMDKYDKLMNDGNRFAFTLEYTEMDALDWTSPLLEGMAEPVTFMQDDIQQLKATIAWGRYLKLDSEGQPLARLEINGSYEDYSDDDNLNDRGVVTLTYTYKVSDNLSVPLVVSYANHGKYLPESDAQLNTHIGISYKLHGQAE